MVFAFEVEVKLASSIGLIILTAILMTLCLVRSLTTEQHRNCISQTTSWSPCSKTCGRGLSTRISNENAECEMVKESRLCTIRPCEVDITKHIKVSSVNPLWHTIKNT